MLVIVAGLFAFGAAIVGGRTEEAAASVALALLVMIGDATRANRRLRIGRRR